MKINNLNSINNIYYNILINNLAILFYKKIIKLKFNKYFK